jgi:hypothetical protein
VTRFRNAARHVPFQAAQNELGARMYLDPMLPLASGFGLVSERALAMVLDRSVQMGVGGARNWVAAVGPVQTTAQRQQALAALGHADLRAFQRATPGLTPDNQWGPGTHAALTAALRALGPAVTPIPIPPLPQTLDAMVRRASSEPWANRVQELRNDPSLGDTAFSF